jgi:ribonuclease J
VSLVLSEKGHLLAEPEVALTGLPAADNEGTSFAEIVRDAVAGTIDSLPKPKRKDQALVSEAVRRSVRAAVNQAWGKKPMCSVLVTVI